MATNLDNIVAPLRAAGLRVVETPGWFTRGYAGQDFKEIRGVVWHHTATNRQRFVNSDAPTLQMCIDGRPDVAGPLCNIVFGRNGTVYLVATGVANHAGAGSAAGIPTDWGNHYLVGIEMESSGIAPWDWTPEQIRLAPVLGAALERALLGHLPEDQRLQIAHYEYSSQGKIDPAGWPGGMDGLRANINRVLGGGIPAASPTLTAPTPAPVTPSQPSSGLISRTITQAPVAWVRTAPTTKAGMAPGYATGIAKGATILVSGYVKGQDPFNTKDNAWYKTKSGFYVWVNAAENNISGVPYLGDMSGSVAPKPAPAPVSPSQPSRGPNDIHWIVERGDSLSKIAQYYYGKAGTAEVNKIAAHNGIKNPNSLAVGQKIYIPGPLVWTVEAPDTYSSIAAYYGLDADYLARKNGDTNRNSEIYIGNIVNII